MNPEMLQVVHEKEPWIEEELEKPTRWPSIEEDVVHVREIVEKKGRRKSWHAIKFERKRRKGVVESDGASSNMVRQKRPSWWNIFAPQQWPRYTLWRYYGLTVLFIRCCWWKIVISIFGKCFDKEKVKCRLCTSWSSCILGLYRLLLSLSMGIFYVGNFYL